MATTTSFLSKPDVKERLGSTKLLQRDASIYIEKWTAEDAREPIYWQTSETPVGKVLVAASKKGVCFLGFSNDNHHEALADVHRRFPSNLIEEKNTKWHEESLNRINNLHQKLPVHL